MGCTTTLAAYVATANNLDASRKRFFTGGNCCLTTIVAVAALVIGVLALQGNLTPATGHYFLISAASVTILGALISLCMNRVEITKSEARKNQAENVDEFVEEP